MSVSEKNRIVGPLDPMAPAFLFQGVPFTVVADLPEGAFVQFINGENPMGVPQPGPQIAKGCMVLLLPPEVAAQIRPTLKQVEAKMSKTLGQPYVQDGHPVARSVFDKPDPSFDS